MKEKYIKIPKGFFKKFKWKINLPTFKCKICGKDVLDIPSNYHFKK